MGLFEHYTRYLALRPAAGNNEPNGVLYLIKLLIVSVILLLLLISQATTQNITTNISRAWVSMPINGQVDNIVLDDRDGSVYLVVDSDIYKYTKEFKLISSSASATSSKVTNTSNDNGTSNDLFNKVLILLKRDNQDLLFSCWHTKDHNLKCWLNKGSTLTSGIPLHWPPESQGFRINPSDQVKALVSQGDTNDLIVAASRLALTNNSLSISYLPSISIFKIVKNPKHLNLEQKSVLQYTTRTNDSNLLYNYVYLFNHNHYTHFILNEIHKSIDTLNREGHHYVRLARICNNDTDLTSYTEISLTCNNQANLNAKFAYTDTTKNEPTLYIVFERDDTAFQKSNIKSMLCSYSLSLIEDMFHKAISDCNSGHQASNLLAKLHPLTDQVPLCQKNPSNEWCTSKTNPYIDGTSYRYNAREDTYLNLGGITFINFLFTTKQGPELKDVLFIGTETGHMTKMSHDEDLFYTVDLNHNSVKNYQIGEKFDFKGSSNRSDLGSTLYATSGRNILATTKGTLHQLNIDACYYYRTCKACLITRDPLECVWCGDTCTQKKDCKIDQESTISCPPIVKNFSPKKGPITGQTELIINGENFGSKKGTLSVKLGDQECSVNSETSNSEVIHCLSKPVNQPKSAKISIAVNDETEYIYSKGLTTVDDPFSYVNVTAYGLYPIEGPYSGGNTISVYGNNLDAGANRTVIIGSSECKVIRVQNDKISCIVKPWNNAEPGESQILKLLLDGHEQSILAKSFGNLNLSTSYSFNADSSIDRDNVINDEDGPNEKENETSIHTTYIVIVILTTISIMFLYLICRDKVPKLKLKLSPAFELNASNTDNNLKVSFRNPQSHKFAETNLNPDGTSINGLVKLNGSIMSNSNYFSHADQLEQDQPLMNNFLDSEMLSLLVQEKILIDRNRLTLGHVLGSGQFGRVYKGFLKIDETGEHAAVAVKTLHNRSSWDDALDNRAFLEEGLMMRDFEHDNVLALIGVTFDSNGLPMVITPFMLYGDLRSYISDEASLPTVKELIDYGTQVARGMAYLSGLKFVHRDLAARNCMLDDNLTVKVADFGLSRDIYERDYYSSDNKKTKLPVKWMAIESLEKCIYNTKTDVWSYGILLWELMTRGVVPYPDVDNFDLFSYLKEGRRMLRPRYCPLLLYKIMLSCWDENPAMRPTFDQLVKNVSDIITQLQGAKDGQQKVSRDITYCDVIK